jgi:hypothetical protein
MNRAQLEQFWLQHQSSELTPADAALLTQELAQNPLQRHLLLRDGETNRTLDALAFNERTADAFTAEVLARWQKEQKQGRPSPSRHGHRTEENGWAAHLFDETDSRRERRGKGKGSWHYWAIAAAVLIAVSLLGVVLLRRTADSRNDMAGGPEKPRLEPVKLPNASRPPQVPRPEENGPPQPAREINPRGPRNKPNDPQLVKDQKENPPGSKKEHPKKPEAVSVARLTSAEACRWKGTVPEDALSTEILDLLSGKATITFNQGAVVEMTGPCRFQLNSDTEGVLWRGKVRAVVPAKAVDFRIQTLAGTITDLRTASSVNVEENGATDVTVEQGTVVFAESGNNGKPGSRTLLKEGETKRFTPKALPNTRPGNRFQGKMNINGQMREFDNREEFEKAQRQMMEEMRKQMEEMRKRLQEQMGPFGPQQMPPFFLPFDPQQFPQFFGPFNPQQRQPFMGPNPFGPRQSFRPGVLIDGEPGDFMNPFEQNRQMRKQAMDSLRQPRQPKGQGQQR